MSRGGGGREGAGVVGEEVYAGLWHFAFFKLSADRRYLPRTQNKPMLLAFSFERTKNRSGLAGGNATCQVYTEAGLNPSPTLLLVSPLFFSPPRRFCNGNGSARLLQRELPTVRFDYAPCAQKRFKPTDTDGAGLRGCRDLGECRGDSGAVGSMIDHSPPRGL